jgi:hypothetical protein
VCTMLHNSAASGVLLFATLTPTSAVHVPNPTAVGMVRASDSSLDWRYAIPFVNDIHNFPLLLCLAFYFLFVFNGYLQSCKCTRIHYYIYYNEVLCFVASAIMFLVTGITYSSLHQFRRHTHTRLFRN